MFRKGSLVILASVIVAGCATPPAQHTYEKSHVYDANFDTTWSRLTQFFINNNIQVKTIEKASGVIYAEQVLVDSTDVADCGQAGMAAVRGTIARLNVFVVPNGDKTTVTVNTNYDQVRQFDVHVWKAACTSTGGLEGQILHALGS